jgi:diguanylate cyclase (GGDEF)-like protein
MNQHQRRIDELESQLIAALKRIAELEIENYTLDKAANQDPLTAIYNRRGFEKQLNSLLEVVKRYPTKFKYPRPVYLAVDIDHFKAINDTYGHAGGDAALHQLAQLLHASVRPYDVVGRFGGEEFTIALLDASLSEAKKRAEAILNSIRAQAFDIGERKIELRVSIGVAEDLSQADQALYKAKESGRDRVEVYS